MMGLPLVKNSRYDQNGIPLELAKARQKQQYLL
jgi:hypothetical protein